MDGPPIITELQKDEGNTTCNGHMPTIDSKHIKKAKKRNKQGSIFGSLRCCFWSNRKRPDIDRTHEDILNHNDNKKSHSGARSITTVDNSGTNGNNPCNTGQKSLLPQIDVKTFKKKCAIIDLDETLVHSSFKPISNADFVVPVEIDGTVHQVYVLKRPHVDSFLQKMGEMYECVLFTASLSKYADPVADLLDQHRVFSSRLFRDSCVFHRGNYVKDVSRLGRDLDKIIIIDNSPASYIFHPDNAVPVLSWFDDPGDRELINLMPYLERIAESDDIYTVLRQSGFTSQATETTLAIRMQLDGITCGPLPQSIMTQVRRNDSEDDSESINQDDKDYEER